MRKGRKLTHTQTMLLISISCHIFAILHSFLIVAYFAYRLEMRSSLRFTVTASVFTDSKCVHPLNVWFSVTADRWVIETSIYSIERTSENIFVCTCAQSVPPIKMWTFCRASTLLDRRRWWHKSHRPRQAYLFYQFPEFNQALSSN